MAPDALVPRIPFGLFTTTWPDATLRLVVPTGTNSLSDARSSDPLCVHESPAPAAAARAEIGLRLPLPLTVHVAG
jgi:hypothetical protein